MDTAFLDPDVERLPPEAVRLLDLCLEPYPDGQRLRTGIKLTPFQKSPNLELTLIDSLGAVCGTASVVEPANWNLQLTLHIRTNPPAPGACTLTAVLSYPDLGETDRRQVTVDLPTPSEP